MHMKITTYRIYGQWSICLEWFFWTVQGEYNHSLGRTQFYEQFHNTVIIVTLELVTQWNITIGSKDNFYATITVSK